MRNLFLTLLIGVLAFLSLPVHADRLDELQDEIKSRNRQIKEIEKDIAEYRTELNKVNSEKRSLQNTIYGLDLARDSVTADIDVTERRIDTAILTIEKLNLEIEAQSKNIDLNNKTLGETIRRINEAESQTLVEVLLSYENLSDFWGGIDTAEQFQLALTKDLEILYQLKKDREGKKAELEGQSSQLSNLRSELHGNRQVIDANIFEKDALLTVTENKEANFQSLIAEKESLRGQFEQELRSAQEALRREIDPDSLPSTGSGVLSWPLDDPLITQYFGNTEFATANPQIYNGGGHNGVDFGTPTGTKVKAALSGTVVGAGDTDQTCRNASYGKWILVRHNNGLTTLYAHLSVINTSVGVKVTTGQTIGFSGNTGYSTGPHLHFTVFASQGVEVGSLPSRVCGTTYTIPLAGLDSYLNPLSYL